MQRYSIRLYDDAKYPDDHARLVSLLNLSAGFHPTEVYHRSMYTSSVVWFVVEHRDSASLPLPAVGLVILEEGPVPHHGKISWIYVTLKHRCNGLGRRLLGEAILCSVKRGDHTLDAFRTTDTHRFFAKMGFENSKQWKHTVTTPIRLCESQKWARVCDDLPQCLVGHEGLTLRRATAADKKSWCALILNACNYDMGGGEMVQITLDAAFRCVAVAPDGTLAGLISMSSTGWIPFLCCAEKHRGQGLGSFLLAVAIEWLRRTSPAAPGELDASLSPLRRRNVAFYERKGFRLEEPLRTTIPFEKNKLLMCRPVDPHVCVLPSPFCKLEDAVPDAFHQLDPTSVMPEPDFGQLLEQLSAASRRCKKRSLCDDEGACSAPLPPSVRSDSREDRPRRPRRLELDAADSATTVPSAKASLIAIECGLGHVVA